MNKPINLEEFIKYLQMYQRDYDKAVKGIGYESDGFYTIHVDDGYVTKMIKYQLINKCFI